MNIKPLYFIIMIQKFLLSVKVTKKDCEDAVCSFLTHVNIQYVHLTPTSLAAAMFVSHIIKKKKQS